jgi:hypothetical protein
MTARWILFASAFALLAACGEGETPTEYGEPDEGDGDIIALPPGGDDTVGATPTTPALPEEDPEPRVAISDVLGTFEGRVTGLAVWEHPSLSFESAILAANGEAGLAVVPIDSEVALTAVEGVFDGSVAVGYPGFGETLVAAASGDDILVFEVGEDRAFDLVGEIEEAGGGDAALCMVGSTLLRAATTGVTVYALDVEAGDLAAERTDLDVTGTACAATEDRFFLKTGATTVVSLGAGGGGQEADIQISGEDWANLGAIAAIAEEAGRGTLIAVTESGSLVGVPYPFEGTEPSASVTPTRAGQEDSGVVQAMAAGSGNFGSVYRDGVVALVDGEGQLKLMPWAGLSRALKTGSTTSRSLRSRDAGAPAEASPVPLPGQE